MYFMVEKVLKKFKISNKILINFLEIQIKNSIHKIKNGKIYLNIKMFNLLFRIRLEWEKVFTLKANAKIKNLNLLEFQSMEILQKNN